jgi:tryptophan synthase alpha chain
VSERLETHLRQRRAAGRKLLVPYITGGLAGWEDAVRACAAYGADAIEIGIPFSDPVMDGPVIQQASQRALDDGATPTRVLDAVRRLDVQVPLVVMTYYNLCFHAGHERFAANLADAGISGCILPDLPLEEAGPWLDAAEAAGVATVLLAAPTAPDERLPRICERSRGFVYAVGLLGVTGERDALAASAVGMAKRLKAVTDRPVLVGVGVSNAAQAAEAVQVADGVIQGASVVRRLLEGGPDAVGTYVAEVRAAIDAAADQLTA